MSMGMNAANSVYACLWCTIHRDKRLVWIFYCAMRIVAIINNRSDITVTAEQCKEKKRTLSSIRTCCTMSTVQQRLGCIHQPLFDIELDLVVVDELHLLLRITDRLISALVHRMAQLDHKSQMHSQGQTNHMDQLVSAINSCGVTFRVRQ